MRMWSTTVEALLLLMLVGAFVCVFYGWSDWPRQLRSAQLLAWRRAAVTIGLFSVTAQAILFVALWTPIAHHRAALLACMRVDSALVLLAVPCIFAWRGKARWYLLASALILPVACFFTVLAELAY
jgi:hypothetical protein